MIQKGQVRWLPKGDVLGLILFLNEILRTERGMKSLRDAYLRGIQRLSSFAHYLEERIKERAKKHGELIFGAHRPTTLDIRFS